MPENPEASLHDLILANGWRQGSFALPTDLGLESEFDDQVRFIAISLTCDLANNDLAKEPTVEFVKASLIAKRNSTLEDLKNPRLLHLSSHGQSYEITSAKRFLFPREILLQIKSSMQLEKSALRILQDFMARRYRRPEYADEFNNRRSGKEQKQATIKIQQCLNQLANLLRMLLVSGDDVTVEKKLWAEDQSESNTYNIDFKGVLKPECQSQERLAQDYLDEMVTAFNTYQGIKATGIILLESALTYLEYKNSIIWDADSVSSAIGAETIASQI